MFPRLLTAACGLSLLLHLTGTAHALNLSVASRPVLPGPSDVRAAAWLPGGARALCLGSRLVILGVGGTMQRALPTPTPCEGLTVNPAGTLAATVDAAGVSIWNLGSGAPQGRLAVPGAAGRVGFRDDQTLLIGGAAGVETYVVPSAIHQTVWPTPVERLVTAPDGHRAVVLVSARPGPPATAPQLQLVDTSDFRALSAVECPAPCPVTSVNFSTDGTTAVAQAGENLQGLRDGFPATTVLRGVRGAAGLPLRDGGVLTIREGVAERRDRLTGHREGTLSGPALQSAPLQLTAFGDAPGPGLETLLAVSTSGELLQASATLGDLKRLQLPAQPDGGGLDAATGTTLARLTNGQLLSGASALPGTYWAVQTRNKTTWTLSADGSGGLGLSVLSGGKRRAYPSRPSHLNLNVNHWGNHAVTWDDDTLQVVSQASGKVTATFKPALGSLKGAQVTLSPDATRAFIFPAKGENYLVLLQNGKRFPIPQVPAGGRFVALHLSGKGVMAFASRDNLTLYRPNEKVPYATVEARGEQARFSNDSLYLATPVNTTGGPRVDIVNVSTGKVEASTPALAALPTFLAWSADSRRLVVGAGLLDDLNSVTVFDVR